MSLPRLDRIDRFGQCCCCTRHLLIDRVIDGKVQKVWAPEYGDVTFLLNDGSKMQVTICKICQNTYDFKEPSTHKDIMDAVMKGWELETKKLTTEGGDTPEGNFIRWSKENGEKYLSLMSKKNIHCHIDSISKEALVERSKELGKEFHAKIIADRSIKNSEEVQVLEVPNVIS